MALCSFLFAFLRLMETKDWGSLLALCHSNLAPETLSSERRKVIWAQFWKFQSMTLVPMGL